MQTRDGPIYQEGRDVVTVNEWTDRIYQHTPQEHIITNVVSGRKMKLQKYNFPDTGTCFAKFDNKKEIKTVQWITIEIVFISSVIWNPWSDQAREMGDLGDDEYPNMLCVEAGHVSTPVILLPGTAFEASQILQVKVIDDLCTKRIIWRPNEAMPMHSIAIAIDAFAQWLHSPSG